MKRSCRSLLPIFILSILPTLAIAKDIAPGQAAIRDDISKTPGIVKIATSSPDHKILVELLQAADYVDFFGNPGPFTVFAPTDAAFKKLPAGTLESLKKPESKEALQNILEYHVFVGSKGGKGPNALQDGETLNQANLDDVKITVKKGQATVNGAKVLGTVQASNGWVHVIDAVLLPPAKK